MPQALSRGCFFLGCAGSHERMNAQQLIFAFEDMYKGMARLYPRTSWTRPQRYVEDEVCLNMEGYLHAKKAGRVNTFEGDSMRCMLHIRQAYRQLQGKPTAFDSGREPADLHQEPVLLQTASLWFQPPASPPKTPSQATDSMSTSTCHIPVAANHIKLPGSRQSKSWDVSEHDYSGACTTFGNSALTPTTPCFILSTAKCRDFQPL